MYDLYDINKLKEAKKLITEVYEYNYKTPNEYHMDKKLETIISKLDKLIATRKDD